MEKWGNCECGDASEGFQTYTFLVDGYQRCFTTFVDPERSDQILPVLFASQCYAKDKLSSVIGKKSSAGNK